MNIHHVSASQVKNFRSCARLWFFQSVLKKRPPQTPPQAKGTAIHAALEAYLKGEPTKPDQVDAADMAEYIEALKPLVDRVGAGTTASKSLVEFKDEMETYPGGPKFNLIVDHAREVTIEGYGVIPQIDDLKTLSDFRYAKKPEQLAKDTQMVSYAKWALVLFLRQNMPLPNFVSIRHVYVRTRGKKIGLERQRLMTPEEIEVQWQLILTDIKAMDLLAGSTKDPMAVMPNTESCEDYGGCFFKPDCFGGTPRNISEAFDVEAKRKETKESKVETKGRPSILDRLRAQQGGAPAAAAASAKVIPITSGTPPAPAAAAAAPAAGSRAERLRAAAAAAAAPAAAPAASAASAAAPAASAAPAAASAASAAPAVAPAASAAPAVAPAPASASPAAAGTCGNPSAFPGVVCTLVPHTGDHESKSEGGGYVYWNGTNIGLGRSENWKLLGEVVAAVAVDPTVAQVLPPDAPPREQPAAPAAATAVASETPAAAAAPPAKRRGRPPGSKNGAGQVAAAASQTVVGGPGNSGHPGVAGVAGIEGSVGTPSAEGVDGNQAAAAAPAAAEDVSTGVDDVANANLVAACPLEELYIDCMPMKGVADYMLGEQLVGMLNEEIASDTHKYDPAAKFNVPDWRLIPYVAKAALAQALRGALPGMPRVLIVTSSTSGSDVLIEVLSPIARRVVRALRG